MSQDEMNTVLARIDERIAEVYQLLLSQQTIKDYYSTSEIAELLHKAEFTVREWCRQGRILAQKRPSGRGRYLEWMIPQAELVRVRNEGLLPAKDRSNGVS